MLKQVSWTDYLSVVAVLLSAYYLIVIWLFYRDEVRQVLAGKREIFARDKVIEPESDN